MVEIKSGNEDESENIAKRENDIDFEQAFHTKLLYLITEYHDHSSSQQFAKQKQKMKNTIRLFKISAAVFLKIICGLVDLLEPSSIVKGLKNHALWGPHALTAM